MEDSCLCCVIYITNVDADIVAYVYTLEQNGLNQ